MKTFSFFLLLLSAVPAPGQEEWRSIERPAKHFSLKIPGDWKVFNPATDPNFNGLGYAFGARASKQGSFVLVMIEWVPPGGAEEFLNQTRKNFREEASTLPVEILPERSEILNGQRYLLLSAKGQNAAGWCYFNVVGERYVCLEVFETGISGGVMTVQTRTMLDSFRLLPSIHDAGPTVGEVVTTVAVDQFLLRLVLPIAILITIGILFRVFVWPRLG
ncbi:MAG: hypothetical protein AAGK14_01345 [Verrucomicrobiota bacterium]